MLMIDNNNNNKRKRVDKFKWIYCGIRRCDHEDQNFKL